MPITDPSEEYFKDGGWHWTGSAWIKGGLAFEYKDCCLERTIVDDATAGTNRLEGPVLPAGELWIITSMFARNHDGAIGALYLGVELGGVGYTVDYMPSLAAGVGHVWGGQVFVPPGGNMFVVFSSCTLNDKLEFAFTGYKMRVS